MHIVAVHTLSWHAGNNIAHKVYDVVTLPRVAGVMIG
jgi:hypothetical protein